MFRLALALYTLIGSSLAGTFVIAALVSGNDTLMPILYAAIAGFVVGVPVSVWVAKALIGNQEER